MTVDEQKVEAAVGKVFGEIGVAITGPLIVLGDRLGLWAAMAGAGPVTPEELAARTGTVERYVREWLCGVAGARIGYAMSTLVCTGFTLVRRVAQESAPFNIVLEARS